MLPVKPVNSISIKSVLHAIYNTCVASFFGTIPHSLLEHRNKELTLIRVKPPSFDLGTYKDSESTASALSVMKDPPVGRLEANGYGIGR